MTAPSSSSAHSLEVRTTAREGCQSRQVDEVVVNVNKEYRVYSNWAVHKSKAISLVKRVSVLLMALDASDEEVAE